ncbi:MAG TPA: hypothetical protein VJV77_03430 [Casimicrobiaceae bacterium]|nr:hypothetical protein [Casimicrobiaceae bacterium]
MDRAASHPRQFARGERPHRWRRWIRQNEKQHIVIGEQHLRLTKSGTGGRVKQGKLASVLRFAKAIGYGA